MSNHDDTSRAKSDDDDDSDESKSSDDQQHFSSSKSSIDVSITGITGSYFWIFSEYLFWDYRKKIWRQLSKERRKMQPNKRLRRLKRKRKGEAFKDENLKKHI